jgi:Xaa-Pro aminopeptidase
VGKNEWILFVNPVKVPAELRLQLEKEKISLMHYDSFFAWLKSIRGKKIFLDPSTASYAVYSTIQAEKGLLKVSSPVALLKVQKNETGTGRVSGSNEKRWSGFG